MGICMSIPITVNVADKIIQYLEKDQENFVIIDFPEIEGISINKVKFFRTLGESYFQSIKDGIKGLKQPREIFKSHIETGILREPRMKEIDIALGLVKIEEMDFDQKILAFLKKKNQTNKTKLPVVLK